MTFQEWDLNMHLMLDLPYDQSTSEVIARVFKSRGVNMYHKLINTLRSMLAHPKDKIRKERQCRNIYHDNPKHTYVGESQQPVWIRFKEHNKLHKPT